MYFPQKNLRKDIYKSDKKRKIGMNDSCHLYIQHLVGEILKIRKFYDSRTITKDATTVHIVYALIVHLEYASFLSYC